jgi:hypothetical protein
MALSVSEREVIKAVSRAASVIERRRAGSHQRRYAACDLAADGYSTMNS